MTTDIIFGGSDFEQLIKQQATFNNLPYTTYAKDLKGQYLSCNELMAIHFGCKTPAEVNGLRDHEFLPRAIANLLRKNDTEVMSSKCGKVFNERFISLDGNGEEMIASSMKLPLKNSQQEVIGIKGFSMLYSRASLRKQAEDEYQLTARQLEFLSLLVKGKPMKQIADALSVAKRTAENYLGPLKQQLNCGSKSQLIEKALSISYIKILL